jgi:hypothetical protein
MKKWSFCFSFLISVFFLYAQNDPNGNFSYNPHDFYTSGFYPPAGNAYRSASGMPGPLYWQNSASYLIHATLNEKDTSVAGDLTITYTNNSPDKLDYLWLQLDQNLFNSASRGAAAIPASGDNIGVLGVSHGGYQIEAVSILHGQTTYTVQPVISDTRMQIRLKDPLLPKGDKISIKMHFHFVIPANGAGRMGRVYTKKGVVYTLGQWYPRMCVYDDVEGWNTLPYMGLGEFYCDYGNFDYYITAPAAMVVFGSGDLQNGAEVLTVEEIKRLAVAAKTDLTTAIIKADEVGKSFTRPIVQGDLTWHFIMKNSRDIAWAASKAIVWDAARVNLPSGRKALAQSAYPAESIGDTAWSRATEYLKYSMEIYSRDFFEYPWNNAVNIGSNITGMEYPGMIFNDYTSTKAPLWFVIAHEIGHNWYPMIVGSNERKYMWQDEGFNSYINYYANDIFNRGEYARDPALFNKNHFAWLDQSILPNLRDPLMTVSEAMDYGQHYQYYSKTAYGLKLLRNVVIGKDRFDYAFRKYTETWAFKHPTPYDFFHCMNNATGEDLNWFWKEWFFTTWILDQSITEVKYVNGDPSLGAWITIDNKGKMIMPVILKIVQASGQSEIIQLPVEIWQRGGSWTLKYASTGKISQVILDPENLLPDTDRKNNEWHGN